MPQNSLFKQTKENDILWQQLQNYCFLTFCANLHLFFEQFLNLIMCGRLGTLFNLELKR